MSVEIQINDGKVLISVPKHYLMHEKIKQAVEEAEAEIAEEIEDVTKEKEKKKMEMIKKINKLSADLIEADNSMAEHEQIVRRVRYLWHMELEKMIQEVIQ